MGSTRSRKPSRNDGRSSVLSFATDPATDSKDPERVSCLTGLLLPPLPMLGDTPVSNGGMSGGAPSIPTTTDFRRPWPGEAPPQPLKDCVDALELPRLRRCSVSDDRDPEPDPPNPSGVVWRASDPGMGCGCEDDVTVEAEEEDDVKPPVRLPRETVLPTLLRSNSVSSVAVLGALEIESSERVVPVGELRRLSVEWCALGKGESGSSADLPPPPPPLTAKSISCRDRRSLGDVCCSVCELPGPRAADEEPWSRSACEPARGPVRLKKLAMEEELRWVANWLSLSLPSSTAMRRIVLRGYDAGCARMRFRAALRDTVFWASSGVGMSQSVSVGRTRTRRSEPPKSELP